MDTSMTLGDLSDDERSVLDVLSMSRFGKMYFPVTVELIGDALLLSDAQIANALRSLERRRLASGEGGVWSYSA